MNWISVYYDELLDHAKSGASRILIGQRGLGKSATIHKIFADLQKNESLPLIISRYDNVPLTGNEAYFLYKIMQAMCNGIAKHLFSNKKARNRLTKTQKERLAFFIELFFDPQTSEEYILLSKEIVSKQRWNFIRQFYNKSIPLLNGFIDGAVEFSSDFIRKSLGVDCKDVNIASVAKEYFKEANIDRVNAVPMSEIVTWEKERLVALLKQMQSLGHAIGYKSIVVLFDKIDEYSEVNGDIDKIVAFVKEIMLDTDLLYEQGLSIIFSMWSDAKNPLNKAGVRFDKFEGITIEWHEHELEKLINKRLLYYSKDKEAYRSNWRLKHLAIPHKHWHQSHFKRFGVNIDGLRAAIGQIGG